MYHTNLKQRLDDSFAELPCARLLDSSRTIHETGLARIEDYSVSGMLPLPSGCERGLHILLPYAGLFNYRAGSSHWLLDSNRVLFAPPGEEYRIEHPIDGTGHACLIVSPGETLAEELGIDAAGLANGGGPAGERLSTFQLRAHVQWLLNHGDAIGDPLLKDEWVVRALQFALDGEAGGPKRSSRLIDRAKEILHGYGFKRLSLSDIAARVGASPVYLTHEFTRVEGMSLYQYQLSLRLSQALLELPHCEDITGLALDLGFSSHSHFTLVFRRRFGMTPSAYRNSASLGRDAGESRPPYFEPDARNAATGDPEAVLVALSLAAQPLYQALRQRIGRR